MPWFFTLYLETLAREDLPCTGTCCALGLSDHSLAASLLVHLPVRLPCAFLEKWSPFPLLELLGILSTRSQRQNSGLASGTRLRSGHPSRDLNVAGLDLSRQEPQLFAVKICEKLNSLTEES